MAIGCCDDTIGAGELLRRVEGARVELPVPRWLFRLGSIAVLKIEVVPICCIGVLDRVVAGLPLVQSVWSVCGRETKSHLRGAINLASQIASRFEAVDAVTLS